MHETITANVQPTVNDVQIWSTKHVFISEMQRGELFVHFPSPKNTWRGLMVKEVGGVEFELPFTSPATPWESFWSVHGLSNHRKSIIHVGTIAKRRTVTGKSV
jgi:hypothetical protein